MSSKYEVLDDGHETTVYHNNELVAVFYGGKRQIRAKRFVDREEYLEQVYAANNL